MPCRWMTHRSTTGAVALTVCLVRWHRLTLQEYLNDMCCTAYRFACYSEAVSTYEGGRYR